MGDQDRGITDSSPALGTDGTVYIGAKDGLLYAIKPDGTLKWTFETGDDVDTSPCVGSDGTVYAGSNDGHLYAVNPDGSRKWAFETADDVDSSPALASDGTVYMKSDDDYLYAINSDGTQKWKFDIGDHSSLKDPSPAVGSDGTIYASGSRDLYAVNPDGTQKWVFDGYIHSSPAIGSDGTIYVGSRKDICAISPDGTQKWAYETGDYVYSSPVTGPDGTVYAGSDDGHLYALNPNGTLKWAFQSGDSVVSSPAVGSDGTVYVGSNDGYVYVVNPDGTQKWTFETGSWVRSSPVIGTDGTVYVGSWNRYIYAINSDSAGPAPSSWPMFHHDANRTGRVSGGTEPAEEGYTVTSDLWIRAVIHTDQGTIEAVWQEGGKDTTAGGHEVIWGYFYASPSDVTWGSRENPDVFVKIWFDANDRIDVSYFHVSVPDIDVYSEYKNVPLEGTTTLARRYIRLYYNQNGQDGVEENYEDGIPATGYSPSGNPSGYSAINDLGIGAIINTVGGPIDAVWRKGGDAVTAGGHQVLWGHFYASPDDVTWGSQNNPDLFVKVWFDAGGRIDVNFFHVSVPGIDVYSEYPEDGSYDEKGTTIMADRYIRHEYQK